MIERKKAQMIKPPVVIAPANEIHTTTFLQSDPLFKRKLRVEVISTQSGFGHEEEKSRKTLRERRKTLFAQV